MDTIRKYLDSMFENLPRSLEVMRAKEELYSMMEDKYTELISEGKKENEAIGIVISEFGNLDELAENLGINRDIFEATSSDRRYVSQQETEDYIYAVVARRLFLSLGIMLCIFAPIGPILFDPISNMLHLPAIEGLGVGLMFLCAAIGVGFIIFSSFLMKSWKFIDRELCIIDDETTEYVSREKDESQTGRGLFLTVGIMLCILSVVPVIIFDAAFSAINVISDGIGPSMIFTLSGLGVFLIVFSGSKIRACNKLLALNKKKYVFGNNNYGNADTVKEENENMIEYVQGEEIAPEKVRNLAETKAGEKIERKMSSYNSNNEPSENRAKDFLREMVASYWKSVTCIYFIWSFLTMNWGSSWVIFPIAALLRGPIEKYVGLNK